MFLASPGILLRGSGRLPMSAARLGTLDCEAGGISRDMIVNPASMGFVSADANLSITGARGAGKRTCHVCLG